MGVAALRHSSIHPLQAYVDRGISGEEWIDSHQRHQLGVDAGVIMACDICITAGQGLVTGICSSWHPEWAETSVQVHQVKIDVRTVPCTRYQQPTSTGRFPSHFPEECVGPDSRIVPPH